MAITHQLVILIDELATVMPWIKFAYFSMVYVYFRHIFSAKNNKNKHIVIICK
ncbi:hypothetical protein THIAE_06995 [Thiomicrospira aerophila AL3]|uniref:Uncharacterized protein n=1 Tax=Thiomicrospira aerophila AL3 TaxID=717772 RepID=W0DZA8_9GAMM|nr:hypothetical protein THIAE_06995 [Thiomicrospira aerophila AL3]